MGHTSPCIVDCTAHAETMTCTVHLSEYNVYCAFTKRKLYPIVQVHGVPASAASSYPPTGLLYGQTHQYGPGVLPTHLDQSVSHQLSATEHMSYDAMDSQSRPGDTCDSMPAGPMQKLSPPVSSQTADFSRFNLSALPSSRKHPPFLQSVCTTPMLLRLCLQHT